MLTEQFGERLKYWRQRRGLTQPELERKTGKSRQLISRYENGKNLPTLHTVGVLLEALNVTVTQFFGEE